MCRFTSMPVLNAAAQIPIFYELVRPKYTRVNPTDSSLVQQVLIMLLYFVFSSF